MNIKEQLKREKRVLRTFRWHKVKESKIVWILFCLSILAAFLCPFLICVYSCDIFYPIAYALLSAISNISFGYISGFIVYLYVTFLPSTRKEVDNIDGIYFKLYMISENLNTIDKKVVGNIDRMNSKDYVKCFVNYLVADFNEAEKYHKDIVHIDKVHYDCIKYFYTYINQEVESIIASFGHEMPNSDVEKLTTSSQLYTEFTSFLIDDNSACSLIQLVDFVEEFASYWHLIYRHICNDYNLYKYCDYEISILKMDFKSDKNN